MKPEELANLVFGGTDVCNIEAFGEMDCDYFKCFDCKGDCTNMDYNGKIFMVVWCNKGCDCHGDVFLKNRKILPRMAKKFITGVVVAIEITKRS